MKTLFITATGTGTGKTYVTAGLGRALMETGVSVRALKPVITGFDPGALDDTDTAVLIRSLGGELVEDAIEACSPWRFTEPLSPDMAAAREGRLIDFNTLIRFSADAQKGPEDVLLIEGIGGAMVPLDETHTVLDWMAELGATALVVAGSYLGTLSHTLTTVAAIEGRGVAIAGVVVDESDDSPVPIVDTVETLARFLKGVPITAVARNAGPADVYEALGGIMENPHRKVRKGT